MPFRYAPLPNHTSTQDRELEASFDTDDDSDVDQNESNALTESHPLNSLDSSPVRATLASTSYNFENLDYDYPPPGSPPRPSSVALPNNVIGNSNGYIPQLPHIPSRPQRSGWFRRAAGAILPSSLVRGSANSGRPVGGGIENDGVFANINAKPGRGRVVEDSESGVHVVPEEVQKESPPSYASAQADAVPPYWETTIHAPATLGSAGEMMVDGLPTGSFFSFLWNLLVSMSFQFVGFLLTFLLHSTHAAKLGSRAGLGITLIHYGFYLRTRVNSYGGGEDFPSGNSEGSTWWPSSTLPDSPRPTFSTALEAEGYYNKSPATLNETLSPIPSFPVLKPALSEGTAEWISFLLMTIGWFILLTSTLSFWRVKRWERSIIASTPTEITPEEGPSHAHNPFYALERFGFPSAILRGMNAGPRTREGMPLDEEAMLESDGEQTPMLPISEESGDTGRLAHARVTELRLQRDLTAAGLL
ncbi:hypothetical protein K439DRAFT_1656642 [Ramaria rubella]|nr:hypothetical protein K439DRAFT_1656642 [Ramaria rubella]